MEKKEGGRWWEGGRARRVERDAFSRLLFFTFPRELTGNLLDRYQVINHLLPEMCEIGEKRIVSYNFFTRIVIKTRSKRSGTFFELNPPQK